MDPYFIAVVIVAFLLAGTIKGALGVGLPTTSIAILGAALGLRDAVPLLIVPSLVANIWQVSRGGALPALLRRFWLINATACVGVWLGTMILFSIDPTILSALLGVVVAIFAVINLTAFQPRLSPRHETVLAPGVGLAAGLLTGTTGSLLLPIIIYLQALGLDKDRFVQAVGLSLLIGTVAWAAALLYQGALDGRTATISALALVPTLLGMAAGHQLRKRLSQEVFRKIVFGLLFVLGANLVYKGLS